MKTKCLRTVSVLILICLSNLVLSQYQVSTWYTFTSATSTYSSLSTGTVLGSSANDDDVFDNTPIGFTFNFLGTNITEVSVNANGYLKFGSTNNYQAYSFPLSDIYNDDSLVSALGDDMFSNSTGTLRYNTLGTSPNRVFVLQWANYASYSTGGTDNLNFQIKLYETTNVIEVVYGTFGSLSGYIAAEVGIRGYGLTDFSTRSVLNGINTWATSFAGTTISDYCEVDIGPIFRPASGRKFIWSPPPLCSGTPLSGTVTSVGTGSLACINQLITNTVSGSTFFATGLSYQWQESANGSTWTSVPSATNLNYSSTFTVSPSYYRRIIACGSNTSTTGPYTVTTLGPPTYTNVPFLENFDNAWQYRCDVRNVPNALCWASNPTTSDSSWRRQDDGFTANWTTYDIVNGNGGPSGAEVTPLTGSGAADFNSYNALFGTTGSLDLYINMGTTQNYDISFYHTNSDGDDSLEVLLSTNAGLTFTKKAGYGSGSYNAIESNWNRKLITLSSINSPSCIVRFKAKSDFGVSDIGIDSLKIISIPLCSGTPTAGTLAISSGTSNCIGQTLNMSVNGASYLTGLTYQWQSSPNGSSWSSISSATNVAYTPTYSSPIYYRRLMSCGSSTAVSNALSFTTTIPVSYAPVPFLENFDNVWQNRCDLRNVPTTAFWSSSPTTGNNSWRRNNDGISALWTNTNTLISPLTGTGCAVFNSFNTPSSGTGTLDLNVNMGTNQNYDMSFYHINDGGNDSLEVFFSTDAGLTFSKLAGYRAASFYTPYISGWRKKLIPLYAVNSSSCIIRFKGTSNSSSFPIGLDSLKIIAIPLCSGTPNPGTLTVSGGQGTVVCLGQTLGLPVTGSSYLSGLSYQWESSLNGTSWTSVSSATNQVFAPVYSSPIYYRRVTACGSNTAVTNALSFTTTIPITYATVPFLENFDNSWQNRCDLRNVPTTSLWSSSPTTGNNSWRRNNDGISANWTYTPAIISPLTGTGCATFNSYNAPSGSSGVLDLNVNMGTNQNYNVTFYHLNDDGNDSLEVFLSTDAGLTFAKQRGYKSANYPPYLNGWNKKTISLLSVNSPSCVLRFKATGDGDFLGYATQIAIDSLQIKATVGCAPTLTLTASSNSICSGNSVSLTVSGANTYSWSNSSTSSVTVVNPSVTTVYSVTGTNTLSCSTTNTIQLIVNNTPTLVATNASICTSSSIIVTASGATSYTWNTGANTASISLSPSVTTNYTVSGSNASGCVDTKTIQVVVVSTPTLLASNGTICAGSPTIVTASGATSYTWNTGVNTASASLSPSVTTNYTVSGSNGSGCVGTKTIQITVNPSPTLVASNATICESSSTIITASGATTYTWNTGVNTASISLSPSVTTNYTVNGSSVLGCIGTKTIQVAVVSTPTLVASNGTICAGSSTLITAGGATSYTWNTGVNTASISLSPSVTTNYTVSGSNASGCVGSKTVQVVVVSTPTLVASNATICEGSSTIITASGATSYTWNTGVNTASVSLSPSVTTNYTVSGSNASGCVGTKTIQITVNPSPTLVASNVSICAGTSTIITASGAASYTWNTGANTASVSLSPSVTTNYTVSGSNALGCIGSKTVQVIANPIPTLSVNNQTICSGGTATLTASGANTYSWNTGSTASFITVSPSGNTSYTVTGTSLGCVDTETVSVTIGSALSININANPTSICVGNSGTLTASGAISYTWNTGFVGTNLVITPTTTTNYTVTGSNGSCNGTNTISIVVNSNPTVNATASQSSICSGQSTTLTASGANTYTWNPGNFVGTSYSISPLTTTIYTVVGANTSGCIDTKTVMVIVNTTPTVTALANPVTICSSQSSTITSSGASTYTWSLGGSGTSNIVTPTSTTVYTVTGTSNGCIGNATVVVNVNPTPTVTVTNQTICPGGTATITASGANTYSWDNGATSASILDTPITNTTYTVTGTSLGCSDTKTVSVVIGGFISLNITPNPASICFGGNATLTASGASSYTWNTGAMGSTLAVSPSLTTDYTVNGSNGSCSGSQTVTVLVNPNPTLVATASASNICVGSTTSLSVTGANNYTWNPGNFVGATYTVNPLSTTSYTVVGMNVNGCLGSQINTIVVDQLPTVAIAGSSQTLCTTASTLSGNAIAVGTGLWTLVSGAGTISTPNQAIAIVTGLSIGNNIFQWTISNGVCAPSSSTVSMVRNISPTVTAASNSSLICAGSGVTLTASGATTYSWNTGELTASIVVSPSTTTAYSVVGDFASACPATANITQSVDPCLSIKQLDPYFNVSVYPNPFNEELTISTKEAVSVQFFNTLGELVIERNMNKTELINTRGFAKGIYHVVITGASNTKTFKVIKE